MIRVYSGLLGKFGDIIAFTPVIAKIKELFPNSEITFAISKQFSSIAPLIERDPLIDRVFITKNYLEGFKKYVKSMDELGLVKDKYYGGQYFDLRGDDEIEEQAKHDIVFETRIWHKEKDWFKKRHVIQEYALHCCGINLKPDEMKVRLFPPKEKIEKGKYIVCHSETVFYKEYPPFDELKEKLAEKYKVIDIKESKNWIKSAQLIRDAKLFIGVDSAPIWLASAFPTPTIGIYGINHFGEASSNIYPINKNVTYLQSYKKDFSDLPVEKVMEAIDKKLK